MSFSSTLRYKVAVQVRQQGSDGEGMPLTGWDTVCEPWADIRIAGGMETIRAGAVTSKVQGSIRLRFRLDLRAEMRVVHGNDIYNVLAVLPDMLHRVHVDLVCEKFQ